MHMKRTTILADERLLAEVTAVARQRRITTSRAIREALERYVESVQAEARPLPAVVGMFDGPAEALGQQADEILHAEWAEALSGEAPDQQLRRETRAGRAPR